MVSMMSNDDRYLVCGQSGHFGCHCHIAQCYSCNEFGHFAQDCPYKIPPSGTPCHQDRSCSRPQYTHTWRDNHPPPTMGTDMRDISAYHNHTAGPPATGAAAITEGTLCSQSSHHSSSCCPSAHGCPCWYSHHHACHRHNCTPSQTCHFSHQCHSCHISTDQASLTPATLTSLPREHSQWGQPSHTQDLQPSIHPTIPRLPIKFFLRFRQWL